MPADTIPASVNVAVKSAWLSKINWTQAVAVLASVLVYFGIDLDASTQAAIIISIQSFASLITWALKTFTKPTATPSQVKALIGPNSTGN